MAQIKEAYVSFETAKLLKEKGFDERCYSYYWSDGSLSANSHTGDSDMRNSNISSHNYTAPTQQMAMRWLREVHGIYIDIPIRIILEQWAGYDVIITKEKNGFLNKPIRLNGIKDNAVYEDACEAAIQYCLTNLIK